MIGKTGIEPLGQGKIRDICSLPYSRILSRISLRTGGIVLIKAADKVLRNILSMGSKPSYSNILGGYEK